MKKSLSLIALLMLFGLFNVKAQDVTFGVIQYDMSNIDASVKALHDAGFTSFEMSYNKKMDKAFALKLKEAAAKYNMKVTTLVGVPGHSVWNFKQGPATIGLVPKEGREEKIAAYHTMIDLCVAANIPAMHSHFGFIPEDPSSEQYKDFIEVMKDLANYAKDKGIMIYFETGQETPTTLIRAIKDIGTGNMFVNCDVANLLLYGKANSADAVKLFCKAGVLKELHAKDGFYPDPSNPYELGKEVKIPTGDVNFPAVFKQLKKYNFKGAITIECEMSGSNKDYAIKTQKYLRNLWRTTKVK